MPNGTNGDEQLEMPDGTDGGEQPQMPNGTVGGGEQFQMPNDAGDNSEQPQMPSDNGDFERQDDFQNFGDQQSGTQPEMPSGDNTEMPDNITQPNENDDQQPNDSGDNGDGKQQNFDNNSKGFNNADFNFDADNPSSQTEVTSYTLTNTDIIYISVSIGVLILGCIIAIVAKRRKS
jgi:hypothetical protein